jgi:Leucine-rich repeat (LRR) protein
VSQKILVLPILLLISFAALSQVQNGIVKEQILNGKFTSNVPAVKRYGQQNVPIYKSKQDSIRIALLDELIETTVTTRAKLSKVDSMFQLRSKLYKEAVIGTRRIYHPSRDFLPIDSIAKLSDRSGVKKITISKVSQLPSILYSCNNAEVLELVNTTIDVLPAELNSLPNLKTVYIHNNRPTKRLTLSENSTITALYVRGENPSKFPKSYKNLHALTKLDLSENDLKKFPNGARHNEKLEELYLKNNLLTLKGPIKKHAHLDQLLLQFNVVERVPGKISRFPNLKKLTFNTNKVVSVSPRIRKLKKLEHISFYKNQLTSIPKGVYNLTSLKEIDLFYNNIEKLDPQFVNWQNLRSLYLSYNKIISLPENLNALSSLDGLYVWENRLTSLPESVGQMTNLKFLRVNGNFLKSVPASVFELKNLQELNLSNNQITELPEKVFEFPQIKILVLENNPWNEATRRFLYARAEELRKRDVYVHLSDVKNQP